MKPSVSLDDPGDVVFESSYRTNGQTWITQADPVALVNGAVLAAALRGDHTWMASHLSLEEPTEATPCCCTGVPAEQHWACWVGWKVSIVADNLTYVYIVKRFDTLNGLWVAAWPD
jgi:hypothetical protein